MMRSFWARTESRSACRPRSASNSSTSRYDKEKRRYQPTARRMTSGSNCLHLNRPETDDARSIGPAYQTTPAKLQHCPVPPATVVKGFDKAEDFAPSAPMGSVATLQERFDKLGRYGPRTLSRGSVQMAPIRTGNDTTGSGLVLALLTVVP